MSAHRVVQQVPSRGSSISHGAFETSSGADGFRGSGHLEANVWASKGHSNELGTAKNSRPLAEPQRAIALGSAPHEDAAGALNVKALGASTTASAGPPGEFVAMQPGGHVLADPALNLSASLAGGGRGDTAVPSDDADVVDGQSAMVQLTGAQSDPLPDDLSTAATGSVFSLLCLHDP